MSNLAAARRAKEGALRSARLQARSQRASRGLMLRCLEAHGIAERKKPNKWWVYLAADPETGQPIYVGKTNCPDRRFYQHQNDPGSAIYKQPCIISQIAAFDNEGDALALEAVLIATMGNLRNRDVDNHKDQWLKYLARAYEAI